MSVNAYTTGCKVHNWLAERQRIIDAASDCGLTVSYSASSVAISGTHVRLTKCLSLLPRDLRERATIESGEENAGAVWLKAP